MFPDIELKRKARLAECGPFSFWPHILLGVLGLSLFVLSDEARIDTYNPQRMVQLVLLGLMPALILRSMYFRYVFRIPQGGLLVVSVGLLLTGVTGSLLNSMMPKWALLDIEYLILFTGMLWFVSMSFLNMKERSWQLFGSLVLTVMFVYMLGSFLDVLAFMPLFDRLDATPGFSNIRQYSDLAAVFIPLSWLAWTGVGWGARFLLFIVNIYWVWLLILTEGRSGLLSLAIGVFWVFLKHREHSAKVALVFLIVVASAFILYQLFPVLAEGGWARDITSSSGRLELWKTSLEYTKESFPFGAGGMAFAMDGRDGVAAAHNLLFSLLAEWGAVFIVGALIFGVGFCKLNRVLVRGCGSSDRDLPDCIVIPVVMAAISSMVNGMFAGSYITPFTAVAVTLAWGGFFGVKSFRVVREECSISKKALVAAVIFFLIWCHMIWLAADLYFISEGNREACLEKGGILYPRFWVQGRLDCSFI